MLKASFLNDVLEGKRTNLERNFNFLLVLLDP